MAYRHWLKSEQWETVRLMAMGWQQMTCLGCEHVSLKNHAHHIRYRETWGKTKMRDLRILCNACHKRIHELTKPADYDNGRDARRYFGEAANKIRFENGLPLVTNWGAMWEIIPAGRAAKAARKAERSQKRKCVGCRKRGHKEIKSLRAATVAGKPCTYELCVACHSIAHDLLIVNGLHFGFLLQATGVIKKPRYFLPQT